MIDNVFSAKYPVFKGKGTPPCATADPEAFFPDLQRRDKENVIVYSSGSHEVALAKKICAECPYIEECLNFALETNEPWGIWGGLTASERRRVMRKTKTPQNNNIR